MSLLEVRNLKKYFPVPGGMLHAVDDVTLSIDKGTTLGVVGESGCGKSTLGRTIMKLLEPTSGEILFDGVDLAQMSAKEFEQYRYGIQMIFQDPYATLDGRMDIETLIAEPLRVSKRYKNREEIDMRVSELMDLVGLVKRVRHSYPHELDGGRRQRVGIARALALNPKFIVCDEPVSALDVSIQAQVLNLLQDLQREHGLTYMFITHDMSVVKHVSDEIAVMYLGQVVEKCKPRELFAHTLHPYSLALLSAIPVPNIHVERKRILLQGELTSPVNPQECCRFAPRCPYATEECFTQQPVFREILPNHEVACHKAEQFMK
ncbi:MAG: ATP-binding cassette domain-containing protein [Ruthenibacterium sp.]